MDSIHKRIREELAKLNASPLADKRYRLTDKRLSYFDKIGNMQAENYRHLSDEQKLSRKQARRVQAGYPVEIVDRQGQSHHYDSVAAASDALGWPALRSVSINIFKPDGSWYGIKLRQFKGYWCRRVLPGMPRPALPQYLKQKKGYWVEVKPPGKPWMVFPSANEAGKKLNWAVLHTHTKKYFPEDGSEYTQMFQKFAGWKTRRKKS